MTGLTIRATSVEQVIEFTAQCADAMLKCLLAEREHLLARNPDAIQETTRTKLALFDQLEKLETRRHQFLANAGYGTDNNGMVRLLKHMPNGARLGARWNKVLDDLARCREANQVNGGILELGRRQAEQALAILRGQVSQTRVYGAGGDTSLSLGHRELGKA